MVGLVQRFPRPYRFPRLTDLPLPPQGYLPYKQIANAFVATSKIKNFVFDVARGMRVKDAMALHEVSRNDYLKLMRRKSYRNYLYGETEKAHREINARMKRAVVRAATVMEETLDDPEDARLRFDASKEILKGRGILKSATVVKQEGLITHEHTHEVVSPELQELFVKALVGRFSGGPIIDTQPLALPSGEILNVEVEAA